MPPSLVARAVRWWRFRRDPRDGEVRCSRCDQIVRQEHAVSPHLDLWECWPCAWNALARGVFDLYEDMGRTKALAPGEGRG